jgi:hypothetical protein
MQRTSLAVGLVLAALSAQGAQAQVVGPARRAATAAGDVVGAPGVGARIENREADRAAVRADVNANAAARQNARANAIADADRWRYVRHNNQWWYYTPQNSWMYHRNNNWNAYDAATYSSNPRYSTGYRGNRLYNRRNYAPAQNVVPMGPGAQNGANLGADIGANAAGPAGANRGAALGGAIGNTIDAARGTAPVPVPAPVNPTIAPPAQP